MSFDIYPYIEPDGALCWTCVISKNPEDVEAIKHLTRSWRYRVEFLEPGNLYISDNARQVNAYFMKDDWMIKYPNGDLMSIDTDALHECMTMAGRFCNYEEDPRDL